MLYTVDANSDEPIMLINKHIGMDTDEGMGIDGALFQQELLQLDSMGKKRIQVWINSVGGVVMDGYNIFNAILKSNTPVDTYNVGIAASIAGVIFMAGRKRIMADYALLMTHPPSGGDDNKVLNAMAGSLTTMLCAKSKLSEADVKYLMGRTTWLASSECLEKGFCTEIEATNQGNKKYLPTAVQNMGNELMKVAAKSGLNTPPKNVTMTKITMKLGLNDAATEDNVISAIKVIEDKAYKAETDVVAAQKALDDVTNASKKEKKEMQDALDKMKKELDEKNAAYNEMKAKFEAMEEDKKKAEDAATELKAKNMVEGFAKAGRIKNEATVILKWTNLAKGDFDATKAMIEELPINKAAAVIPVENKLGEGEQETSAALLAAKNRLKREGKL